MGSRVDVFAAIRRDARVEGLSVRELARRHGVHPLTTEPWGIRRFFLRAPDGTVLNIAQHRDP